MRPGSTLRVRKTSDIGQQYLKLLTYGYSGVGKTYFAGTATKPLIISCESGLLTLRGKDIDCFEIKEWEDVEKAFVFLRAGGHEYETVVLDSLTELQKKLCDKLIEGKDKLTIGDWGLVIDKIRRLVRHFRDLPMNVVIIALADQTKDDETGRVYTVPSLNGKALPNELAAYFDVVLYQFAKKTDTGTEYLALTHGEERCVAKDRSGMLPAIMVPDFETIHKAVFTTKEKANESKPVQSKQ